MADHDFWLVYIAVMVLLPIIPAIVLFKLLPSHAALKGPFRGHRIDLGGGFAAYFVVLLLLLGFFPTPPASQNTQVWRVTGTVGFTNQEGVPFENVRLSLVPPLEYWTKDGKFDLKVLATRSESGEFELPTLQVEAPGYKPSSVSLEGVKQKSPRTRRIELTPQIKLRPLPPYNKLAKPLQPEGVSQ